ncbi:hypothetical protein ABIC28_003702 [Rhodococcus sp. PvR044]|jgi:hypothetical protein|uniref:DUF937 domain-containing protein n=1 Tax=Rhodococcus TaxID=1827 RepID=UPI000BC7E8BD|nr:MULTISPECIES: DUF937 domain-containing protein [Rhodococcus]MBP1160572.1 hypothetical protein [Rhodococcus sp. PvR099]MCZ4556320.1 DUF937 domain-containing protein [Rhodococcus maanshanensis]PTR43116.1 uncharacterized protein DUF937 [Rhodococcus sp. OK611]SNX91451.1 protein of unknown function [Rhodococcus sp. OK270]
MASLDDLLSQIPISQIAAKLGVDEETATAAVKTAIPTLVGGLEANAQDPAGAASLETALAQHSDPALLTGGVDIDQVDEADGEKIVNNVFGDNKNQVISALGNTGGAGDSNLVGKLLPILAPIVLAFIAKQFSGGGAAAPTQAQSGGGIGDLLGGLLGGGGQSAGGLGNVLGSLLGGAAGGGAAGGLGDLLGGLLGGGRK